MEAAAAYVGISVKKRKDPITYDQFLSHRMGKYRYKIYDFFFDFVWLDSIYPRWHQYHACLFNIFIPRKSAVALWFIFQAIEKDQTTFMLLSVYISHGLLVWFHISLNLIMYCFAADKIVKVWNPTFYLLLCCWKAIS